MEKEGKKQEKSERNYLTFKNPEMRLMSIILKQAIDDFRAGLRKPLNKEIQKDYKRAREWIFCDEERYILSFLNICKHLNLNYNRIRDLLKKEELIIQI